ncbi:MAG: diacylglycerol/polyprenol kinase family protein [Candidatus Njordarchaeia archaeon]
MGFLGIFPNDIAAFVFSFLYVFLVVGVAKFVHERGASSKVLRELTHTSMGVWPILWFLFQTKLVATLVPLIVTIMLAVAPKSLQSVFSDKDEKHIGLVFYAFSFTVITYFFWMEYWGAAAIFSLSFGDGLGGLIGSRYGRLKYKIPWVKVKTIEGSTTVFIIAFLAIVVGQMIFNQGAPIDYLIALVGALFTTIIEAISPYHSDNLTIPLLLAPFLMFMSPIL